MEYRPGTELDNIRLQMDQLRIAMDERKEKEAERREGIIMGAKAGKNIIHS